MVGPGKINKFTLKLQSTAIVFVFYPCLHLGNCFYGMGSLGNLEAIISSKQLRMYNLTDDLKSLGSTQKYARIGGGHGTALDVKEVTYIWHTGGASYLLNY